DPENRIVVISGPNAGGKSITLKTVGLLQLMLQTGILIPVHERSKAALFEQILTDIGDNQSIENHLSTYSYRLKNMKFFLRKCNANTLFLIDEFGTGSDPELGGALAEVMLEDFYEREAFGLITTHYSNLKALANELPAMVNANMQFDNKTLEPVFKLVMGEAGSSFTFEVAQKNGLPFNLINRAKKKIERGKVRFDATIAKLQKERSAMMKTGKSLKEKEDKVKSESDKMQTMNAKLKAKLTSYQELFDHNQRMIVLGNKVNELAERYFTNNKKRPLIAELLRIIETENAKRKRKTAAVAKKDREQKKKLDEQVKKDLVKVRKEKKKQKKQVEVVEQPKPTLAVGDQVRLFDGRSVGSIDAIEKQKAIVNYGAFTTQVSLDLLELVKSAKKVK
ncbi:MAG: MutS-related protein, partial [Flavobacteriaceae bacterium]